MDFNVEFSNIFCILAYTRIVCLNLCLDRVNGSSNSILAAQESAAKHFELDSIIVRRFLCSNLSTERMVFNLVFKNWRFSFFSFSERRCYNRQQHTETRKVVYQKFPKLASRLSSRRGIIIFQPNLVVIGYKSARDAARKTSPCAAPQYTTISIRRQRMNK